MTGRQSQDDDLNFAPEDAAPAANVQPPWKVLITDDEREVHHVTKLALDGIEFAGRPLQFLDAYSGEQACSLIREHDDVALILMDVVMESEHAGLEAVRYIRETLGNRFVRIVLRTGQPGQAPEREVITRYDINDYKEKTELTTDKLFTALYTGLSAYRDLLALECARNGLEQILLAATSLFELQPKRQFFQGVLQQITALLRLSGDAVIVRRRANAEDAVVLAAAGHWAGAAGRPASRVLEAGVAEQVDRGLDTRATHSGPRFFAGYIEGGEGAESVLYLSLETPLSAAHRNLADRFCRHLSRVLKSFEQLQA